MKLIDDIKNFFFYNALKKDQAKLKSVLRKSLDFDEVKTVGIIFNATKTESVITVTQFADLLKNAEKKVQILGYQDFVVKDQEDHRLFNKSDVNWYGMPITTKIVDFQEDKFDVLICAYLDECKPLEYIAATTKAVFRVGAFNKSKTDNYELMINVDKNPTLKYMLDQTVHFLNIINK